MAIGNPLGTIFANIFLDHYETKWLDNCLSTLKPQFYQRYVDNTFLIFKDSAQIKDFYDYVNIQHQSLHFTYEMENDDHLPFIGIDISKYISSYQTGIYHKPTSTDLFTNYSSFLPENYKYSALQTLVHRTLKLCSNFSNITIELDTLQKVFIRNGYPPDEVNKFIKKLI